MWLMRGYLSRVFRKTAHMWYLRFMDGLNGRILKGQHELREMRPSHPANL